MELICKLIRVPPPGGIVTTLTVPAYVPMLGIVVTPVPVVPVEIEVVPLNVSVPASICVTIALPLDVPSGIVTAKVPIVDPLRLVVDANPEPPTVVPPLLALVLNVFVVTCAAPVWMVQRVAPSNRISPVADGMEVRRFDMCALLSINKRCNDQKKLALPD